MASLVWIASTPFADRGRTIWSYSCVTAQLNQEDELRAILERAGVWASVNRRGWELAHG